MATEVNFYHLTVSSLEEALPRLLAKTLQAGERAVVMLGSPERVEGSAVEFCQVVTQGRNIRDTRLTVKGEGAVRWMAIAQCFAGAPKDPPAPGERAW